MIAWTETVPEFVRISKFGIIEPFNRHPLRDLALSDVRRNLDQSSLNSFFVDTSSVGN